MSLHASILLLAVCSPPIGPICEHRSQNAQRAVVDWGIPAGCEPSLEEMDALALGEIRHPAPEVVVTATSKCGAKTGAPQRYSSFDSPRTVISLPLASLQVEVFGGDLPMDVVELRLDGCPLSIDPRASDPVKYELPCPSPGRHVLHARFRSGHHWSDWSNAFVFEMHLPRAPRIVALETSSGSPIVPERNGVARITGPDVRLRLANVGSSDQVLAYLDGRPVPVSRTASDCCFDLRVQGQVAAGVHQLTVRTTPCADACAIASPPSNVVFLHYYDERVYLLRPGSGCPSCPESPKAEKPRPASHSTSQSPRRSPFTLVAWNAPNPAAQARQIQEQATRFRDLVAQSMARLKTAAEVALGHAGRAEAAVVEAELALAQADEMVEGAKRSVAALADEVPVVGAELNQNEAQKAASQSLQDAKSEVEKAIQSANAARSQTAELVSSAKSHAATCRSEAAEVVAARELGAEWLSRAELALQRTQAFAAESQAQSVENVAAAETARQKAEVELGRLHDLQQKVEEQAGKVAGFVQRAAASREQVEMNRNEAQTAAQTARLAHTAASHASQAAEQARRRVLRLQHPQYREAVLDQLATAESRTACDAAVEYVQRILADAKEMADEAVADSPQAAQLQTRQLQTQGAGSAEPMTAEEKIAAAKALAAWFQQVDEGAAKAHSSSLQRSNEPDSPSRRVAQRAAAAAEAEVTAAQHLFFDEAQDLLNGMETDRQKSKSASAAAQSSVDSLLDRVRQIEAWRDEIVKQQLLAVAASSGATSATNELEALLEKGDDAEVRHRIDQLRDQMRALRAQARAAAESSQKGNHAALTLFVDCGSLSRAAQVAREQAEIVAHRRAALAAVSTKLEGHAQKAEELAVLAAGTGPVENELKQTWDQAEVAEQIKSLRKRVATAASSQEDVDVLRAKDEQQATEARAAREDAKSIARIRSAEAQDRIRLAENVVGPASPLFFASAAHFPLRGFGLQGQPLDRDGLIIYEDMEFRFDREGNYEVHFRTSVPEMPVTLSLQFHLQASPDSPWHTITLAPIRIAESAAKRTSASPCATGQCDAATPAECCGPTRPCVCRGHSEILRRCYGEMSRNQGPTIRRTGTARFGYGMKVDGDGQLSLGAAAERS